MDFADKRFWYVIAAAIVVAIAVVAMWPRKIAEAPPSPAATSAPATTPAAPATTTPPSPTPEAPAKQ
jgi:hypothetical protein